MGVGMFSDCVFFLKVNSLPFKERTNLKTCITTNGGAISLVVNEKCTHVVVVSNAALNSSQQKTIQKHNIPIVKPDFIWRSIQENCLVEVGLSDSRELEVNLDQVKDDKKSKFLAKFMKHIKTDIVERDLIDDEEFESDEKDLPYDTEVAKYSFFQKGEETAIVEILCFGEQCPFPFKISTVCGIPGTSQKEVAINLVDSSEKACNKYEQRMKDLENKGYVQIYKIAPEAECLASRALQKVLLGEALNVTELSLEVAGFVEAIWTEAQGHLTSILSCPVENISLNDVSKAEGILQNVRNALNKNEDVNELIQEFYQFIPHCSRERQLRNIDKKFLTAKQDLCQLIRDMVNISETNSSRSRPGSVGKYRALKCRVEYVHPNTEEFHRVKKEILDNNHSNEEFQILRVFRIGRLTETINFTSDLGNVKSLLHASSPRNIVGILSRGLLLPKIIVDEFGLERTDIGNLGSGIYFSDSVSTSVKYTEPFRVGGERVLLVCDVALGETKNVGKRDYSITEPPEGFHSLHGVRNNVWTNSQFFDDEFVVYNVNQVKMRYLVQFVTSKDAINLHEPKVTLQEENEGTTICEPTGDDPVEELPEAKVLKGGLQGKNGQQIPLQSIHVKARVKDLAAQVIIFQTYKNDALFPIEAKYVFPLDSTAAVCGFEAFINGKHIVGEVKEKQQAHREYRTAISQGHGAYLMDQDTPDVFTVSVGNLPAKATVIIKITYVTELENSYSYVFFSIPGTVASWQEDQALKENTQDTVAKVGIEGDQATQGNFCFDMSIEMPRKIENIWCHSHTLKIKKTECKAVVQVEEGSSLTEDGISLYIGLEDAYIPRMWVETHPDQDSEACMLIFKPEFEDSFEHPKITIFLDCSNSMESCFQSAKRVALLALDTLFFQAVNIITFGSTYKELYLYPKGINNKPEIEKFIKIAKPNMGSTEFWKPLQSTCLLRPSSGYHKILLISDGHLQNENLVFQILKKNKNHVKLFTCGVGANANKHMLRCLAKDGAGAFEYFADKSKSSWKSQMEKHDLRLKSAACTAVSIKWRLFGTNPAEPMQAPANIQSLYDNEILFVYGFVPHCTQATLKGFINNKEFEHLVSTTELQKTTGTILHKLTARAFIRDYEDGILHEKEHENEMEKQKMKSFIIKLSKEHSIVTQFTSFVAVEKRSAEESENIEPNIHEIISAEDVDILPYMGFTDEESQSRSVSNFEEEESQSRSVSDFEGEALPIGTMFYSEENVSQIGAMFGSDEDELPVHLDMLSDNIKQDLPGTVAQGFGLASSTTNSLQVLSLPPIPTLAASGPKDRPVLGASSGFSWNSLLLDGHHAQTATDVSQHAEIFPLSSAEGSGSADLPETVPQRFGSLFSTNSLLASSESQSFTYNTIRHKDSSLFRSSPVRVSLPVASPGGVLEEYSSLENSATELESYADLPKTVPQGFGSVFGTNALQASPGPGLFTSIASRQGSLFGRSQAPVLSPFGQLRRTATGFYQSPGSVPPSSLGHSESATELGSCADFPKTVPQVFGSVFGTSAFQAPSGPGLFAFDASRHEEPPVFGSLQAKVSLPFGQIATGFYQSPGSVPPSSLGHSESAREMESYADESRREKDMAQERRQINRSRRELPTMKCKVPVVHFLPSPPCEVSYPLPVSFTAFKSSSFNRTWRGKRGGSHKRKQRRSQLADLTWSSLSPLQSQEGYWMLTSQLGELLNIDVEYLCDCFLNEKGISSLGLRGKEEVLKLIATLLVLQTIRTYNLLSGITFKTLMKLGQCDTTSESYAGTEKAVSWAARIDRQYSGICCRLGLGRDWEHATRQLLGLEIPSSDLSLALYH